ncbi:MAG: 50S ribosomal protein L10 [Candidatus Aminicenantes bacterium]|nr:50S ribosomal protein L10 [Candidatus Aminicenantes bacterium]
MASRKNLEIKQKQVDILSEIFSNNGVYLIDYRGLAVKEMEELRNRIRKIDANIKVIKNRLAIKYFEREEKSFDQNIFIGPTAVAYGDENFIEVAKTIVDFEKESKNIKIKAGFIEQRFVNDTEIKDVAKLPGKPQLMSQLAFSMSMPLKKFGMTLSAPLKNMMILLNNLKDKKEKEENQNA